MTKIVKSNTSIDEPLEKRELEKTISGREKKLNMLIDENRTAQNRSDRC